MSVAKAAVIRRSTPLTRADFACPECGGRFIGSPALSHNYPPICRPCPANNFAHAKPVATLPLIGCEEPPLQTYRLVLRGFGARASTPTKARELLLGALRYRVGGDTKKAGEIMDRLDLWLDVEKS